MSDLADRASEYTEQMNAISLANAQRLSTLPSAEECETCGEPIPQARREQVQGCTRCIDCQSQFEQRARHYRK